MVTPLSSWTPGHAYGSGSTIVYEGASTSTCLNSGLATDRHHWQVPPTVLCSPIPLKYVFTAYLYASHRSDLHLDRLGSSHHSRIMGKAAKLLLRVVLLTP
jgi:hypothetical protein